MEARQLRKEEMEEILARFRSDSSDVNKRRTTKVAVMEAVKSVQNVEAKEVAASQIVAERVETAVVAESDSERVAERKSPKQPNLSTKTWRTTGSRPATRILPTRDSMTIWTTTSRRTQQQLMDKQPKAKKLLRLRRKRRSEL